MLRVGVYRLVPASLFPISSTVHSTDKKQVKYHVLYTVLIILCTVRPLLMLSQNVVLFCQKETLTKKTLLRPTLMRDRKRKIPDRKSAVSDLAKSFSFREQKLSYVRSKNRLGFTCCGVSCIPLFASSNSDR